MKRLITGMIIGAALVVVSSAIAADGTPGGVGDQIRQQDRDQLQTCDPALDQDRTRTRLQDCLPEEVNQAVKEMKQTREQYQQQLREKKAELTTCTDQQRDQLREQLRECIKDQTCDRVQLRERLQEMRECVPTHDQIMEQARERTRDRDGK